MYGYRLLEEGEVTQKGDDWFYRDEWLEVTEEFIGDEIMISDLIVRRPITKEWMEEQLVDTQKEEE